MVEEIRFTRAKHRDLVGDAGDVRDIFTEPHPRLAVLTKFFYRPEQLVVLLKRAVHEREPFAFHELVRDVTAVPLGKFRFPVVQL